MVVKFFYFSIIAFFLGIIGGEFLVNSEWLFYFLLLFVIFSSIFLYLKFLGKKINSYFILIFLVLIFFIFGWGRSYYSQQNNQGEVNHFLNQKINLKMLVDEETEQKTYQQKIIVKFLETNSRAVVWYQGKEEFFYGDLIQVEGYVLKPENFTSQNGEREFDYVSYLKKEQIFYTIQPINIKYISSQNGNFVKQKLLNLKKYFLGQIRKMIPEPEASLLGGLILGAKENMGKSLLEDFRRTGVIHIVVLSGYNLSLVADFFMKILAFFGVTISAIFGSISIVLFTIMTGASATIVRAAIMALLIIFAKMTGRTSEIIRALFLAAVVMLLFNPMLLLYDPSFQLSFLATLGLIILGPKIEEWLKFVPKTKLDFRGILAATLATQVFVLPLILYMMGSVSIISPVVNLLILIFIPLTMLFGFLAVVFSVFIFPIGLALAFVSFVFLAYDLKVVEYFANLSFAVFEYQNFTLIHLLILYFLYFIIWLWYRKTKKEEKI